jgi:hypothetical protein
LTGRQEEEVAEEEAGPASLPRRTGLLVGRRRIRCRKVTGGEDAKDEGAEDEESTPRGASRWEQPLPVLATSAASREREAAERTVATTSSGSGYSKWVSSWQLLVEDSAGDRLA